MLLATHAEESPASIVRTAGPNYAISMPSRVIFAIRSSAVLAVSSTCRSGMRSPQFQVHSKNLRKIVQPESSLKKCESER